MSQSISYERVCQADSELDRSPEALTAFMLMAGVDLQLLDASDLLPRLRDVAARLKRGLG